MSEDKLVVFPLSEIQFEFIQARDRQSKDLMADGLRKLAKDLNVPVGVDVRLSSDLKTLVIAPDAG